MIELGILLYLNQKNIRLVYV